jgi:hypothetical protein
MSTQYAFGRIVTSGLVLALDAADKNSYVSGSTTWRDLTVNNYNGTLTNGPTFISTNGGSINFDGVDDHVNIPYNSNFNLTSWTLSSWVKLNTTPDFTDTIISRGYDSGFNLNYYIDCRTTNFQAGSFKGSPTADHFVTSSTTTASRIGLWTNIVAYRTTDYKVGVYINGIRENEVTYTLVDFSSTSVNSTINLGALNQNGTMARFLNAQIASSQLYNRALSASEIIQNYNAQKSRFGL